MSRRKDRARQRERAKQQPGDGEGEGESFSNRRQTRKTRSHRTRSQTQTASLEKNSTRSKEEKTPKDPKRDKQTSHREPVRNDGQPFFCVRSGMSGEERWRNGRPNNRWAASPSARLPLSRGSPCALYTVVLPLWCWRPPVPV